MILKVSVFFFVETTQFKIHVDVLHDQLLISFYIILLSSQVRKEGSSKIDVREYLAVLHLQTIYQMDMAKIISIKLGRNTTNTIQRTSIERINLLKSRESTLFS